MSDQRAWDKESVYDEQIFPLMSKVIAICQEHEIPIVCTFQYGHSDEDGALLCTTVLTKFERTDPDVRRLAQAHGPKRAEVLAETVETLPDGSKRVTITRV